MKKILFIAALLCSLTACKIEKKGEILIQNYKSGRLVTRVEASETTKDKIFEVKDFNSIIVNGNAKINYTQGPKAVSLVAGDNIIDKIKVSVEDNCLLIDTKELHLKGASNVEFNISCDILDNLNVFGSIDFNSKKKWNAVNFALSINGGGNVNIENIIVNEITSTTMGGAVLNIKGLECDKLKINGNGSIISVIEGNAKSAEFDGSGTGSIDIKGLKCKNINSNIEGSSIQLKK